MQRNPAYTEWMISIPYHCKDAYFYRSPFLVSGRQNCAGKWHPVCVNKIRLNLISAIYTGLPRWHSEEESPCQWWRRKGQGFNPLGWENPLEQQKAAHLSILPGNLRGQRSLAGHRPGCHRSGQSWAQPTHIYTGWMYSSRTTSCFL